MWLILRFYLRFELLELVHKLEQKPKVQRRVRVCACVRAIRAPLRKCARYPPIGVCWWVTVPRRAGALTRKDGAVAKARSADNIQELRRLREGEGGRGGGGEGARCPAEARYQLLKSGHTGGVRTLIEERERGGWGGAVVVGDGATVYGWVRLSSADPAAPADTQCCLNPRRAQLDHPHPANASRSPVSRINSCGVCSLCRFIYLFIFFFNFPGPSCHWVIHSRNQMSVCTVL